MWEIEIWVHQRLYENNPKWFLTDKKRMWEKKYFLIVEDWERTIIFAIADELNRELNGLFYIHQNKEYLIALLSFIFIKIT